MADIDPTLSTPRELEPASALRRFTAFLIDLVVVVAMHFIAGQHWQVTLILFVLYHTVSVAVWARTLGKAAMGLLVQHPDGTRLGWIQALLRSTLGYLASAFLLLGFLHVLLDPRHRGWHDLLFGSEVVQQPGPWSFGLLIRAVDHWTEDLDAWQKQKLARFNRLEGLIGLVLKLAGVVYFVQNRAQRLIRFLAPALKRITGHPTPAGAVPEGTTNATAATGGSASAASTVTALVFAGATVVIYQITAPPGLRPWDARPTETALVGDCHGTIVPSVTRGYEGDSAEFTITIAPPFDKIITRVTTNNPRCPQCEAAQEKPGWFELALRFVGPGGSWRVEFVAYDKEGRVRCRGYSTELTGLGPRPP
jgi:uncharacterized RDD family membrane protein YckC